MRATRLAASLVIVTVSAAAAPAFAQAPPPLGDQIITAAQLSADQIEQIGQYASYWSARMSQADPAAVEAGRDELIKPLLSGRVTAPSPTFRLEYSKSLIDDLKPIINGKNSHAAVNALRVTGVLGTDRALELALNRADKDAESRAEIRAWAAKAFLIALRTGNLQANSINSDTRQLKRAAEIEDDWLALGNQLAALAEVDRLAAGDSNILPTLAGRIDVLTKALDKMAKEPGPSALIKAVYPAIFNLRNEYIGIAADRQRATGAPMAVMLGRFLDVAARHWETARADAAAADSYSGAVADAEELIRLIDKQLRAPDAPSCKPEAAKTWKDGDKAAFSAIASCWSAILGKAPYKPGP